MADISKIKTLNGTTYDIKDAKTRMFGVYYVEGPSTDKTAGKWTGVSSVNKEFSSLPLLPGIRLASGTE